MFTFYPISIQLDVYVQNASGNIRIDFKIVMKQSEIAFGVINISFRIKLKEMLAFRGCEIVGCGHC